VETEPEMIPPDRRERCEGLPVPIERRRKPSGATMAKRGFTERAEGRMPAASVRRDGMGSPEPT